MVPHLKLAIKKPGQEAIPLESLWPAPLSYDDPQFMTFLRDLALSANVGELELSFPPHKAPEISEPGLWNLIGDRLFQEQYPDSWNYLDPDSPNYSLKQLQKRIYVDRFESFMNTVPSGARVLDLGGGIGRFAGVWLEKGYKVTLADPNSQALRLALGHLAQYGQPFELWHIGAEDLQDFADNSFWAVSALEVFCYLSKPSAGLREAVRVLKPNGLIFVSVESSVGSLDPNQNHTPESMQSLLDITNQSIEGDRWVHYFTKESLRQALESEGLIVESIFGTHYLPDGPLHRLLNFSRLQDPTYQRAVIQLERLLDADERWSQTPRAWTAVARKK